MAIAVLEVPLPDIASLSVAEAAHELSCSPDHVRKLISRSELPASRLGRRLVIRRSDVEAMLLQNRV